MSGKLEDRVAIVTCAAYHYGRIDILANVAGIYPVDMIEGMSTPQDIDFIAKQTPLQRTGDLRDIGNLHAFLASDDADYITGTSIRCDGGFALPESAALMELEEGAYNDVTTLGG